MSDMPLPTTYIDELPHPAQVVHYHPDTSNFTLGKLQSALEKQVNSVELDLQYRSSDGAVVCNHNGPEKDSPTLSAAIDTVLTRMTPTGMYGKAFQFFLVLEPKTDDQEHHLINGIVSVLQDPRYQPYWSTSVSNAGAARPITVVITGKYRNMLAGYPQLCIVEDRSYPSVTNLAPDGDAFQWRNYQDEKANGKINDDHAAGFNVRVWDSSDRKRAFSSGADAVNTNLDQIDSFEAMLKSQRPRGHTPSLAIRGTQAALVFRGSNSDYLYTAVGSVGADGLVFSRQILMSLLLSSTPMARGATLALAGDGRLFMTYQGKDSGQLWYLDGAFQSSERFLRFDGTEHKLETKNGECLGTTPSVAIAPDGRIVVVYATATDQTLLYVTGTLDNGVLTGTLHMLTKDAATRGSNPSVAISPSGRVLIVYEATSDHKLSYYSGTLTADGKIDGAEHSLTRGDKRRGFNPCPAFDADEKLLIAYRGTSNDHLWYVYGALDADGVFQGEEFELTRKDGSSRGYDPTVAFHGTQHAVVMYRGLSDDKLLYVYGTIDADNGLVGREVLLDMSLDRW